MKTPSGDYSKLIKQLRKRHRLTQTELGNILSVGKTAISNYETGYSTPPSQTLKRIASEFEEDYAFFMESENVYEGSSNSVQPKYSQPGCKFVIPYFRPGDLYKIFSGDGHDSSLGLSLPDEMLNDDGGELFCIKVSDDAMEEDGICKNDYVIVKKSHNVSNKQIVLIYDVEENAYLLRRYMLEDHLVSLVPSSNSPSYRVIRYDVHHTRYKIIGYVVKGLISFDKM